MLANPERVQVDTMLGTEMGSTAPWRGLESVGVPKGQFIAVELSETELRALLSMLNHVSPYVGLDYEVLGKIQGQVYALLFE